MEPSADQRTGTASSLARAAFGLGLGSLLAVPVFGALGWAIEEMGMMSPLLAIACPAALAAMVLGAMIRRKEPRCGRRLATAGLALGAVTLVLTALTVLAMLVLFWPGHSLMP